MNGLQPAVHCSIRPGKFFPTKPGYRTRTSLANGSKRSWHCRKKAAGKVVIPGLSSLASWPFCSAPSTLKKGHDASDDNPGMTTLPAAFFRQCHERFEPFANDVRVR